VCESPVSVVVSVVMVVVMFVFALFCIVRLCRVSVWFIGVVAPFWLLLSMSSVGFWFVGFR